MTDVQITNTYLSGTPDFSDVIHRFQCNSVRQKLLCYRDSCKKITVVWVKEILLGSSFVQFLSTAWSVVVVKITISFSPGIMTSNIFVDKSITSHRFDAIAVIHLTHITSPSLSLVFCYDNLSCNSRSKFHISIPSLFIFSMVICNAIANRNFLTVLHVIDQFVHWFFQPW